MKSKLAGKDTILHPKIHNPDFNNQSKKKIKKKKKGCTEQLTSEVMEKIAEGILELDKNLLGYLCLRRNTP